MIGKNRTRIGSTGTEIDQDLGDQDPDRDQGNAPWIVRTGTRTGTGSREAEIENLEAGTRNPEAGIANLEAGTGPK